MKIRSIVFHRVLGVGCLASLVLTAGCANYPEPDNIRFGESVRHTIALQTTDPNAGATGLDGEKAEGALRAYRGDVAAPQDVSAADLSIDMGN